MQQTPHSPRPGTSRSGDGAMTRPGQGVDLTTVRDFGPLGRLDTLGTRAAPAARRQGDGQFAIPALSVLDIPVSPPTPQTVQVPHGALTAANADGVRLINQRTYLELASGQTALVEPDPDTAGFRQRAPHQLAASGPVLQRIVGTSIWSPLPHGRSLPAPRAGIPFGRLDPHWDLQRYNVAQAANVLVTPVQNKRAHVIEGRAYYVDEGFNLARYREGQKHIIRLNQRNTQVPCGSISEDGIFRITGEDNQLSTYLGFGSGIGRVEVDSVRNKWKLTPPVGSGMAPIFLDTGGRLRSWVPELRLERIGDIICEARTVLGYTRVHSDMSRGYPSAMDKHTYRYMRQYARQIIAFDNPHIRSAPTLQQDGMIDAHIWREGYPYDRLLAGVSAAARRQALPVGLPQFDQLQGMGVISARSGGSFNIDDVLRNDQLSYRVRQRNPDEQRLFEHWAALDPKHPKRGKFNEDRYSAMLINDGYRIIEGGKYGGGQNGFDLVFKGPADDVYLLEVKHATSSSVGMGKGVNYFQMEDLWVNAVLSHPEAQNSDAGRLVRDALDRQRLFKLAGATLLNGDMVIFKIDMSTVRD